MYAIIQTGGKQYMVEEGDELRVEKLGLEAGEKVEFDQVLAVSDDSGLKYGQPTLDGAKVEAELIENGKAKKVIAFKFKAKKGYRRKKGHRQPYSKVKITNISL